jgi:uncharacterized protein YbjT (DUF2867 family)
MEKILLTGATGYVGGRLLKKLTSLGFPVRCLTRKEHHFEGAETALGDVLDRASLEQALMGIDVAFFLVHSMGAKRDIHEFQKMGAQNFADMASRCGVKRIIFLGVLEEKHLSLRHQIGNILRSGEAEVIEFRASQIIGAGSLSFELVKAMVENCRILLTPRWLSIPFQPIALDDLIVFLIKSINIDIEGDAIYEIGGRDKSSYRQMIKEYSRLKQKPVIMVPLPVMTTYLSSLWLALVTPVYARVSRKIIRSTLDATVVHDPLPNRLFAMKPVGVVEALKLADSEEAETRWIDSVSASQPYPELECKVSPKQFQEVYKIAVDLPGHEVFAKIQEIGGGHGYYYANSLWRMRGFIDLLCGGVGHKRGRRHPHALSVGDVVDFWRVEAYEQDRRLKLYSETKVPGELWLEFVVEGNREHSLIRETITFKPQGRWGTIYFYCLYPFHSLVFKGLLKGVVKHVQEQTNR